VQLASRASGPPDTPTAISEAPTVRQDMADDTHVGEADGVDRVADDEVGANDPEGEVFTPCSV